MDFNENERRIKDMKKRFVLAIVFVFASLFLMRAAMAADLKIGYVDLSVLFDGYSKTQEFDKALTDKQKAYEADISGKAKEVKDLQDKFNLLSDAEKEKKKDELQSKVQSLQQYDQQKQSELLKDRDARLKEILTDIEEAVKQYAQKEGYSMIINDRVLIYQDKSLNITDKIAEILSKSSVKK